MQDPNSKKLQFDLMNTFLNKLQSEQRVVIGNLPITGELKRTAPRGLVCRDSIEHSCDALESVSLIRRPKKWYEAIDSCDQ